MRPELVRSVLRQLMFGAVVASIPMKAQAQSTSDRIVGILTQSLPPNPSTAVVVRFTQTYIETLHARLGPLDAFLDVIDQRAPYACNLLCRAHVVPGFRVDDDFSIADLIRYVFTATCYGVVQEKDHSTLALADLESVLGTHVGVKFDRILPDKAKRELREIIGDTLLASERVTNLIAVKSKYPNLYRLWQDLLGTPGDSGSSNSQTNLLRLLPSRTNKAAASACRSAWHRNGGYH